MDYFSEVFQIDYPLPKVDLLAVHEVVSFPQIHLFRSGFLAFDMLQGAILPNFYADSNPQTLGAMENWGLMTYRTTTVLFDEAKSAARYKNRVAYLVAHGK